MRLHVHASLVFALMLTASAARAQTEGQTWALVYASAEPSASDTSFQNRLDDLRAALQARGIAVLADMAGPIEQHHSRRAIEIAPDRLQALREALDTATRHLALGELQDAREKLAQIDQLQQGARDYLNREISQAQKVFSACVTMAYLMNKNGQREAAEERMRMCADTFPGFDLPPTEFSSGMRKLFHDMTAYRADRPVWLLVESRITTKPCTVRLNGVDVGRAPLRMRAREGLVRVQLECSERPGRIYERELGPGQNALTIDPSLDRAMRVVPPWVTLEYENSAALERAEAHAIEIGRALGVDQVAEIVAGNPLGLRRIDVASERVLAESAWSGRSAELASSLDGLLRASGPSDDEDNAQRVPGEAPRPMPASNAGEPTKNVTGSFNLPPAAPVLVTVEGVLWASSLVVTAAALNSRGRDRYKAGIAAQSQDTFESINGKLDDYASNAREWGAVAITLGATTSLLGVVSALTLLPEEPRVPVWAWAIGGIGLAAVGTGAIVAASVPHCNIGNYDSYCRQWIRDQGFGPFLMIHGAAPLSVGLTYVLDRAFRSHVQADIAAGTGFGVLRLGGRF